MVDSTGLDFMWESAHRISSHFPVGLSPIAGNSSREILRGDPTGVIADEKRYSDVAVISARG
jgi:hypothetical protein